MLFAEESFVVGVDILILVEDLLLLGVYIIAGCRGSMWLLFLLSLTNSIKMS